ncbi:ribulose-phosphate 3-epimerase [Collinsella sp. An307]|uniref:ribulose-phosphate 3-epimerase n=1 Tax=Collinsella sp. An307 TaxID=1965630 RepID=UPI000B37EF41|nr:ribulose-phosphate 3-epimerase [Collinsella sp. An307]OUO19793.1 ribulose-phosphate 3-epimerase [Collinsella sp. An307]
MTDRIQIAPSILSVNLGHLASSLDSIKNADYVHIDVMDGHFTPNLTFGPEMVRACKGMTDLPLDVHLMITNPDETIDWYIDAGADLITVHYETASHLNRVIEHIKSRGVRAGVVLNPSTPVCMLENIIDDVDVVMLMSVNPGFSGQSFIEGTIAKLETLTALCRAHGVSPLIEVDGGISPKTIERVVAAGANLLVAGSAVFGAEDPASMVDDLRRMGEGVLAGNRE